MTPVVSTAQTALHVEDIDSPPLSLRLDGTRVNGEAYAAVVTASTSDDRKQYLAADPIWWKMWGRLSRGNLDRIG
jgi:hypothetical protein